MEVKITPSQINFFIQENDLPIALNSWEMAIENYEKEGIYLTMLDDEEIKEGHRNNVQIYLNEEQAEMLAHTLLLMVEQNRRQASGSEP